MQSRPLDDGRLSVSCQGLVADPRERGRQPVTAALTRDAVRDDRAIVRVVSGRPTVRRRRVGRAGRVSMFDSRPTSPRDLSRRSGT